MHIHHAQKGDANSGRTISSRMLIVTDSHGHGPLAHSNGCLLIDDFSVDILIAKKFSGMFIEHALLQIRKPLTVKQGDKMKAYPHSRNIFHVDYNMNLHLRIHTVTELCTLAEHSTRCNVLFVYAYPRHVYEID